MEAGAPFPDDPGAAELAVLGTWRPSVEARLPPDLQPPPWPDAEPGSRINTALAAWAKAAPRPLAIFLDEIDALVDTALVSVLRQLRLGYPDRPRGFPWSLALIGLRDVRDYKVASGSSDHLGTSSPFNIKVESVTLRDFTRDEVAELYQQHTDETGQVFLPDAVDRAFALTRGQPWLVNALARQLVQEVVPDAARAITAADVDRAKEALIERQDTHLDSLAERLREPRVRQVIEPILAGALPAVLPTDDLRYVIDLGLVRQGEGGTLEIANPIYREQIPLALTATTRAFMPRMDPIWRTSDGRLDPARLLDAFLAFWRQHGEPMLRSAAYHEVAPQLVLMAFLHRVVNGGGSIEREYAVGTGRIDLLVRHGDARLAIELKVWRDGERDPAEAGLAQIDAYLAGFGLDTGWLVIFDRRSGQPPTSDRTRAEAARTPAGRAVTLVRA
jgi:hypothetical protein